MNNLYKLVNIHRFLYPNTNQQNTNQQNTNQQNIQTNISINNLDNYNNKFKKYDSLFELKSLENQVDIFYKK